MHKPETAPSAVRTILRSRPYFSEADIESITALIGQSLRSGSLTNGPLVKEFEHQFETYVRVKYAIAVSTGTAALEISLRAIGVAGREVIVPTQTFVASVNSVVRAGGTPIFAEIRPDTYCLDIEDVERKITTRTAAVMLVHMAGLVVPNVCAFQQLCAQYGIDLIEDAAHAHGASQGGKYAGSFGRTGCFSFYPTKVVTSAEGGMITTDDEDLASMARSLRNHGANADGSAYIHVSTNMRMSEPLAAVGLVQLSRLGEFIERRNNLAARYTIGLRELNGIHSLPVNSGIHSYWNYVAVLDEQIDRRQLAHCLKERHGVEVAWPYDPPCHLQPVFQRELGTKLGDLPRSEELLRHHITLPMHCGLSADDVDYVLESIQGTLAHLQSR